MNRKVNYYWLLAGIPLCFIVWFFIARHEQKPMRILPYYGKKNGIYSSETGYHKVKPFALVNQYNQSVTEKELQGKIYVTDFFFTTCQSICPVMSNQLERVYRTYYNHPKVMIISHTVDPEEDSVNALMDYAKQHHVTNKQWLFLTGEKKQLYDLARQSYLLNAEQGSGGEDDFIHTQNFALIDDEQHIRGFYDGTDSVDVSRLITDINVLLEEDAYKKNQH